MDLFILWFFLGGCRWKIKTWAFCADELERAQEGDIWTFRCTLRSCQWRRRSGTPSCWNFLLFFLPRSSSSFGSCSWRRHLRISSSQNFRFMQPSLNPSTEVFSYFHETKCARHTFNVFAAERFGKKTEGLFHLFFCKISWCFSITED